MKLFFAILLLMVGVCIACASRPPSPQTTQNPPAAAATPTQPPDVVVSDKVPCTLGMDQAPVVNGLRLGMTQEQVLALFPGSSEDAQLRPSLNKPANQFGVSNFQIRTDKYQSTEKFAGISQITFTLLDGRVSSLRVGYNGPEYSHVDKFVAKFTEGTNLSAADVWEPYVGLDTQLKTLRCNDFEVQIFAGGRGGNLNYVVVRDLVADKTQRERRAKAKQQASP